MMETSLSIGENFANKDMKTFWMEVYAKRIKVKFSKIIDGKSKRDIFYIFRSKFMHNNGDNDLHEPDFISILKDAWQSDDKFNLCISAERIMEIVKTLNTGVGHDEIHKIFLKGATYEFLTILTLKLPQPIIVLLYYETFII